MSNSHKRIGQEGEQLAARFLSSKGYEIVARNYRWARGEIDLIVKKDDELIFVEVKAATNNAFGDPEARVDLHKQKQIIGTAEHYLQQNPDHDLDCRFDVIALTTEAGRWHIQHFENAFWAEAEDE